MMTWLDTEALMTDELKKEEYLGAFYEVTFGEGPLGVRLGVGESGLTFDKTKKQNHESIYRVQVDGVREQAQELGVYVCSWVLEVGGQPAPAEMHTSNTLKNPNGREEFEEMMKRIQTKVEDMISQAPRPLTIRFATLSHGVTPPAAGMPKSADEVLGVKRVKCACKISCALL